jgi:hypothetical protein
MVDGSAHFNDPLALHQHLAGLEDAAGLDIEQARGAQHDRRLRTGGPGEHQRRATA